MKHSLAVLLLFLISPIGVFAQQIQLFAEDFEQGSNKFTLNSGGPFATSGTNSWIVNNEYDGLGVYPNTINQDSTINGTINNAPNSTYLHIHDEVAAQSQNVSNTNWDPLEASDNFAFMTDSICTLGLTDIILQFFYHGEGDTNAYMEVYYSADNGPWTKTGKSKYNERDKWEFEPYISDPDFSDRFSLRFGFRWVNPVDSMATGRSSIAVDDIIVVGTYDAVNNPIEIEVFNVDPDTVCAEGATINFFVQLNNNVCAGNYRVQFSNGKGNFNNPTADSIFYNVGALFDTTLYAWSSEPDVPVPSSLPPDSCYKVRLVRFFPNPVVVGTPSECFVIEQCPNIIDTKSATVTTDPDTVCALSAIDVKFTSKGSYANNNVYIAELSDSSGSFANPDTLGTLPSRENYDPDQGKDPGTVSGLIPSVPTGCNYYIRVTSSNPSVVGSLYGPFCIKQCDISTNNYMDIQACITDTGGLEVTVPIDIHTWNSFAQYGDSNQFIVQVLSQTDLSLVNQGGLGVVFDTTSTTLTISIPDGNTLASLGLAPGAYYLRIIADSSTAFWDLNGTIVRLIIGVTASAPPQIILTDSIACNNGEQLRFLISPYNSNSRYQWLSPILMNGAPFFWEGDDLIVTNYGAPGFYSIRVREFNNGCYGPYSDPAEFIIVTTPNVNITGPTTVCVGDTVLYSVPFIRTTYYDWDLSFGTIVDTSNNELLVTFDSVGTAFVDLFALNDCGSDQSNPFQVEVITLLDVDAGEDTTICAGETVELTTYDDGLQNELETSFLSAKTNKGVMFDIVAIDQLTLSQFTTNFSASSPNPDVEIYYKQGTHDGFETMSNLWTLLGSANGVTNAGQDVPTDLPIPVGITMQPGERYGIYITVTDNSNQRFTQDNSTPLFDLVASDGILEIYKGKFLSGLFSGPSDHMVWNGIIKYFTKSGLSYTWSNGDTTQATLVMPDVTTTYTITITDTVGCRSTDEVVVNVNPTPAADAGVDQTVCGGATVNLMATGGNTYVWDDNDDLSATNIYNPVLIPREDDYYVVTVSDSNTGCFGVDSVMISVYYDISSEDTLLICPEVGSVELAVTDYPDATYQWSTGETTSGIRVNAEGMYEAWVRPVGNECFVYYNFEVLIDNCVVDIIPPDAFTPNGDGRNDFFTVYGVDIVKYNIKIFNRWGEIVYESDDASELNDLSRGWNGSHKGAMQDAGTFVYYIEAQNRYGLTIRTHGDLTLIR